VDSRTRKGFTLIELLLVIAVGAVLIAVIVRAVDPVTRMKQARDAKRKHDINVLASAITQYQALNSQYPLDTIGSDECDSSKGTAGTCPGSGISWNTSKGLYKELIEKQILKQVPVDPINDVAYYYSYEPRDGNELPCSTEAAGQVCRYWIGARLEKPTDASKPIFRCSDIDLAAGWGCKEVSGWNQ
jgi:prepilin-type N-terminal cleavage/methylation domain-containing protein